MMTLARVISDHWHAVERDLLSLGYHADDIGTKLSLWELVSIVIAAPPTSAVYHYQGRPMPVQPDYTSTGPPKPVSAISQMEDYKGIRLQAMPIEELKRKREETAARLRKLAGEQ